VTDTDNGPSSDDDGPEFDEGPITLPKGARCGVCAYAVAIELPAPSVIAGAPGTPRRMLTCRRMPPCAVVIQTREGAQVGSQPPIVEPDYVCFEFEAAVPQFFEGSGEG
jgi:hypothetical protein